MDKPVPGSAGSTVGEHPYDAGAVTTLPAAAWLAARVPVGPVLEMTFPHGLAASTLSVLGLSVLSARPAYPGSPQVAEAAATDLACSEGVKEFEMGTLSGLPFPKGTFHGVLCHVSVLLEHDVDAALDELERVTAQDGVVVVIGEDGPGVQGSAASPNALRDLEVSLAKRFGQARVIAQTDWLVSAVGDQDWDHRILGQHLSEVTGHTRKDAFVAASRSSESLDGDATFFGGAIDIQALSQLWTRALRTASAGRREVSEAQRLAADRSNLIRELYLSEQALAEAFDIRGRLEGLVATAAEQQQRLTAVTDELASARTQLAAALTDVDRGHAEIARLLKAAEDAHLQVQAMKTSTSWRITQPLRMLTGRLKLSGTNG